MIPRFYRRVSVVGAGEKRWRHREAERLAVVRSMTRSNFVEARRMRVCYPSRPSARMVSCTFGLAPIRAPPKRSIRSKVVASASTGRTHAPRWRRSRQRAVSAARLCEAEYALFWRLQDGAYHLAGASNADAVFVKHCAE